MKIVILGLSITSSWGNGHATTFRGLVRELTKRGHEVLFLERDVPWYAAHRDLPNPPYGRTAVYSSLDELRGNFADDVAEADFVMVGSYVPEGVAIGEWVTQVSTGLTSFYDIDTPVTLARLERDECEYLARDLIPEFDLYLSFTGGPTLRLLELKYGAQTARPLYCSVDPELYFPEEQPEKWALGYLGTYSEDRQSTLESLLLAPARLSPELRFVVAGPQYPERVPWAANVGRIEHLAPNEHRAFYNAQRFTLNVTRRDMRAAGYSPSVRLFEAAACGTPIVSDRWDGIEEFFQPGEEIFLAEKSTDVMPLLHDLPAKVRGRVAEQARARVLAKHTAAHRAAELEEYIRAARQASAPVTTP